jgi:hypothetical protein
LKDRGFRRQRFCDKKNSNGANLPTGTVAHFSLSNIITQNFAKIGEILGISHGWTERGENKYSIAD